MIHMVDIIVFILVSLCIIIAARQAFTWFMKYSSITHQSFKELYNKGMLLPTYLNSNSDKIDNEAEKLLTRLHMSIYLFMFLGIGIIIIHSILY
jgi:hypothetical protein